MLRQLITAATLCTALSLCACASNSQAAKGEDESMCKQVKPGVVTSVNHYCAVVNDDPVNPAIVREYKGQKVGFCCAGCLPRWDAMTEAQKDAALKTAIAKGKP